MLTPSPVAEAVFGLPASRLKSVLVIGGPGAEITFDRLAFGGTKQL